MVMAVSSKNKHGCVCHSVSLESAKQDKKLIPVHTQ